MILDRSAGAGAAMAIQVMIDGSVKHAQQDVKFVVPALVRGILSCLKAHEILSRESGG